MQQSKITERRLLKGGPPTNPNSTPKILSNLPPTNFVNHNDAVTPTTHYSVVSQPFKHRNTKSPDLHVNERKYSTVHNSSAGKFAEVGENSSTPEHIRVRVVQQDAKIAELTQRNADLELEMQNAN